ncbi:hypothetical protein BO71DRAFT_136548 [Aspergillus ellipticus CBS 707.79]|uniref:Allergen Asp f 4 n=1 Tax=Aspergillus ellipticus CBS 707.79 TaxID=1448320 RepID=A0A319EBH4_9EURO|nr:hypothetical protein BO71DRAFT_136548 [Aspergillus ellipticus CBS 707.79]
MQWKSLLLAIAVAESALARSHGHQRRQHDHGHLAGREVHTVVAVEHVTLTTTVYGAEPTDESSSSTTSAATTSDASGAFVEIDTNEDFQLSASIGLSLGLGETTHTSTTTHTHIATHHTTSTTHHTTTHHTSTSTAIASSSATATSTSSSDSSSSNWYSTLSSGDYSTSGFGAVTTSSSTGVTYSGNVGSPWGSNIIEVSSSKAHEYKYVIQVKGSNTSPWFVSFWNKIGPDGKMDGWYGHSALNFSLAAGETRYVAFDEDSQGGWGAAEGDSLPTDEYGGYSCTWGEFDFGDTENESWSGWDVSAIQAQNANQTVQGMRICEYEGKQCSYITEGAGEVVNAYTASEASVDGIGGTVSAGALRLTVEVDYS